MTDPARGLGPVLKQAAARLAEAGVASPRADAEALAAYVLGVDSGEVRRLAVLDAPVLPEVSSRLDALVGERVTRVPLQHLTGSAPFRRLTLAVGPGVFVPRPETEVTAGLAIDAVRGLVASGVEQPVVVDLATGSGAIALAVADECPAAVVHAVEADPQAHAWAAQNIATLSPGRVEVRLGDARAAYPELEGRVDVVVTNPPYIPEGMVPVDPEVRDHDPALALYGGSPDGLALPLAFAERAATLLRPGGVLVMEHADAQGASLPAALAATGQWDSVADHPDLAGRPRVTTAQRSS